MSRALLLALGLSLITGCFSKPDDDDDDDDGGSSSGTSQEEFIPAYAQAACEFYEACDLLDYFGGTIEACLATLEPAIEDSFGPGGECTFDPSLASECLSELEGLGAEDCEADTTETGGDSACTQMCDGGDTVDTGW